MKNWPIDGELRQNVHSAMRKSPWFKKLEDTHFESLITMAQLFSYDTGEEIVKTGDPSDAIFLLMRGSIIFESIKENGDAVELGRARSPFAFGEVGLLLSKPRTATVVADEDVYVLRFETEVFRKMFDEIPAFRMSLVRGLASRLEEVSGLVLPEHTEADGRPDSDVLNLLPMSFIEHQQVLPLSVDKNTVTVGFVEDPNPAVMSGLRSQLPGMVLQTVRISAQLFKDILSSSAARTLAKKKDAGRSAGAEIPSKLYELLERTVAKGASDLHLVAGRQPSWRIDGEIEVISDVEPLAPNEVYELFEPILEERHRHEFTEFKDTDFAVSAPGVGRFRTNLNQTNRGVNAALRLIPWQIMSLDKLGLPAVLKTLCTQPKGLVLVTGPTGSGKSTTLAALIDYINRMRKCHIVTIEDPIEFVHEEDQCLINQREIGTHVQSFERGLRAALREDPDVVLLGELRERETATLALEIANTGHLVFSTVHTNSAVNTVERIIDMFPADAQPQARSSLADNLRGVISQILCKGRTGGRVAAVEVLVGSIAVANLIREDKPSQLQNVMQVGGKEGNRLLNDDLARLVRDRKVLYEEALTKTIDRKDLARRLGKLPAPDPTRKKRT
jgi:twitching motility protein PilT